MKQDCDIGQELGRAGETEGGRSPTGGSPAGAAEPNPAPGAPNPEVRERPLRRRFSAEYKLRILQEAEQCAKPGSIGGLLRREGLYSSHLDYWRRQRDQGIISALQPGKRGPKPAPKDPLQDRVAELERENQRLRDRLDQAETIIEIQKKVSELLGLSSPDQEPTRKG
jgi:transposase-like protein